MTHPSPHDAFVKAVFGRRENAIGELKAVLPAALLAQLDLSTLQASPKSFVDERLASRHSDLLLQVELAGRPALLYILLEHQSTPDPLLTVRLAVYMGRIWDEWLRDHEDDRSARPAAIIPLVLYHGATGWSVATELLQAFDLDLDPTALEAIRPHLPNFKIVLDDLVQQQDGDLRRREAGVLGRMAFLLLKHLREVRHDLSSFQRFLQSVADLVLLLPGGEERTLVMSYIMEVVEGADPEAVMTALGQVATPEVEADVITGAEKLRREGEVRALLRLLNTKFPGQVTAAVEKQVQAADKGSLEVWLDRVLSAASVEEVLLPE